MNSHEEIEAIACEMLSELEYLAAEKRSCGCGHPACKTCQAADYLEGLAKRAKGVLGE
jgi:hypothetical protein